MNVLVQIQAPSPSGGARPLEAFVRAVVRRVLALQDAPEEAEVSVLLVDDGAMRDLNAQYRGLDRTTDVLAFAMQEGAPVAGDERLLGDVVVSLDAARRQAPEQGHSTRTEIAALLAHGTLHLLGFDHEETAGAERRRAMREAEARCLADLRERLIV